MVIRKERVVVCCVRDESVCSIVVCLDRGWKNVVFVWVFNSRWVNWFCIVGNGVLVYGFNIIDFESNIFNIIIVFVDVVVYFVKELLVFSRGFF